MLLTLSGNKPEEKKQVFDFYDLFHFVKKEEHKIEAEHDVDLDTQIFKNAIELPNIKVRECMVPRTEIVGIDLDDNISNLIRIFNKTGHSKVIVYRENVDQVIGYVHMIDLFENPETIKTILRPIIIIAESMPANKLLKEFTASNRSLGLVVDEYGGTAGIVTIEDVLEEIFGEIEDEFDNEDLKEVVVSNNEYIFSARHEIDYLNEKYDLNLPMGDYETLGGYILEVNESIPKENDIIETDEFKFTILTAQENRIENVGMIVKEIFE